MSVQIPERASAVVIGGGVIGSSVTYHLAKLGWTDVVQLERNQFSCGTTWHAAGLVGTMRANESQARLCEYSMAVLSELEAETGQSTGFKQVGSLSIAHSEARFEELKRVAAMNNAFGVTRVDIVTPEEIKALYPYLETGDLLGGSWVPQDGTASPVDVTQAFVKGARGRGALCLEGVRVTGISQADGRVTGVITDQGEIKADYVVNCAGLWGREIGRMAGVNVPLHACEHYYAHTEKLDDLPADLPVMRDHDKCAYYREDAGSLLIGAFEPNAVPWGQNGIPLDFAFEELEGHLDDQFMPVLENAMYRVPMLQDVGWRSFFCGPESFTPDDQFHMGEAPELKNFYVACGLNSVGIQTSGGLGRALADWMHLGHAPMDLWGNDIRRMFPFQSTQKYIQHRVTETLGLLYEHHYPYRQMASARNLRHSPLHDKLVAHNACFGEAAGWERPNWFAPEGVTPEYEYSFGKQNWFEHSAAEHRAAREKVVLFDQSSFSKYLVQGRDACQVLQRVSSADVDVAPPLERIRNFLTAAAHGAGETSEEPPAVADLDGTDRAFREAVEAAMASYQEALDDDFNSAGAIGHVFELVRAGNAYLSEGTTSPHHGRLLGWTRRQILTLTSLLGLEVEKAAEGDGEVPEEVLELVQAREEARRQKDWARADELRDRIQASGWVVEDRQDGPLIKSA
jgi:4-methylaminobutanoate oxidase (formaldehyde-forming)